MFCKKCGHALPSHGFTCLNCGAMMSQDQIKEQKRLNEEKKKQGNIDINLVSDEYSKDPIKRDYREHKENKLIGALIILVVLIFVVVIALLLTF